MKPLNPEIKLEVLISAYGAEGLRRIARLPHPQVEGVHYLVSWQPAGADVTDIPDELVVRDDFDLTVTETVGSACNRNNAIEHSNQVHKAEIDNLNIRVSHTEGTLSAVGDAFNKRKVV